MNQKVYIDKPSDEVLEAVSAAATEAGEYPCITSTFDCNGGTRSVTTCQNPGESAQDWIARHRAEVEAAMKDCK